MERAMGTGQLRKHHKVGNPTTAIVIPAYNGQIFLRRALRSLLSQSVQDFEVIVVSDDGFDYLPYAQYVMGERVRQVYSPAPRSGPAISREAGIAATNAQVIGFLDVDDEYAPRRLERLVPLALEYGAAASNHSRIDDATGMLLNESCPEGMPAGGFLKAKHIAWLGGPVFPLVRRDCLPTFPDMWLFEDVFFLLRVVARIGGAMPLIRERDAAYRYLVQKQSLSHGTDKDDLVTSHYQEIIRQSKDGGPLFEGISQDARDAFHASFTLRAIRSAAYDDAKVEEPGLDFQTFSPRYDRRMAELLTQVPAHLLPWAA
jgi:glycosyltransferase involved in cell wall biosynthesis